MDNIKSISVRKTSKSISNVHHQSTPSTSQSLRSSQTLKLTTSPPLEQSFKHTAKASTSIYSDVRTLVLLQTVTAVFFHSVLPDFTVETSFTFDCGSQS